MKRPSKQKCIDLLVEEIKKGIDKQDVLAKFGEKWQYPEDTFNKHWLEAQERYSEQRRAIEAAKMEETIRIEKEAVKRQIMDRMEILETLTKLAKGEAWKVGEEIIAPSANERINAIKTINQMQGYNAADKIDHTSGGKPINIINLGNGIPPDDEE